MAKPLSQYANRISLLSYCFALEIKLRYFMNGKKMLRYLTLVLIGLTASGILMVSLMAFVNPQSVMDLVQVKLANNDAYSSIRGVYGGAGMTLVIALIYLAFKD
jgi:hypothetical protein